MKDLINSSPKQLSPNAERVTAASGDGDWRRRAMGGGRPSKTLPKIKNEKCILLKNNEISDFTQAIWGLSNL